MGNRGGGTGQINANAGGGTGNNLINQVRSGCSLSHATLALVGEDVTTMRALRPWVVTGAAAWARSTPTLAVPAATTSSTRCGAGAGGGSR